MGTLTGSFLRMNLCVEGECQLARLYKLEMLVFCVLLKQLTPEYNGGWGLWPIIAALGLWTQILWLILKYEVVQWVAKTIALTGSHSLWTLFKAAKSIT